MSDAILNFLTAYDYIGVFLLMVAENIFPPIPSEVVLPFIGHLAATGELQLVPAIVVATLGAVVGTSLWFVLGWVCAVPVLEKFFDRYGGYVAISKEDFQGATRFFERHKRPAVFFGRMIPTVRSVISIPAGSVHMSPVTFLFLTFVGSAIWNTALILLGYYVFDDYYLAEKYMGPIGDVIIVVFAVLYIMQVVRFVARKKARSVENTER